MFANYTTSPAAAGYGARIFIKVDELSLRVEVALNELSKWGSHDKRDERGLGWEFGEDNFIKAIKTLTKYGYKEA